MPRIIGIDANEYGPIAVVSWYDKVYRVCPVPAEDGMEDTALRTERGQLVEKDELPHVDREAVKVLAQRLWEMVRVEGLRLLVERQADVAPRVNAEYADGFGGLSTP